MALHTSPSGDSDGVRCDASRWRFTPPPGDSDDGGGDAGDGDGDGVGDGG